MGIEVDWTPAANGYAEPLPQIPDGQTVPHEADAAEAAVWWESGARRAQLVQRLGQVAWWVCCFLVTIFIVVGSRTYDPSQ